MNPLTYMLERIVLILMVFVGTTLLHWGLNGYIIPVSRLFLGIGLVCLAVIGFSYFFSHGVTMWKVVPICEAQKLDVRQADLLNHGHFRKCDTRRGGGGYDQFPSICHRRYGRELSHQFVVQLYGCPLRCHYCYVTLSGIWGRWEPYTTEQLMMAFLDSGQEVLHLMGGAPAIYLDDCFVIDLVPYKALETDLSVSVI